MNLFGNKPQEKAMGNLIHDTNASLSSLRDKVRILSEYLKKNGKGISDSGIETSTPFIVVEYLKTDIKRMEESIDLYYKAFEKDFVDKPSEIPTTPG